MKPLANGSTTLVKTVKKTSTWSNPEVRKSFINQLESHLGIKKVPEDWYRFGKEDVAQLGGESLLAHYGNSLIRVLSSVYPQHEWKPWNFGRVPSKFWEDPLNRRKFLDSAAKGLGFTKLEDWYAIKYADISDPETFQGTGMIKKYFGGSIVKALSATYPELDWKEFKFRNLVKPRNYWDDDKNVAAYLDWLRPELKIQSLEDWHLVTANQMLAMGCQAIFDKYGGKHEVLTKFYPDFNFVANSQPKAQKILFKTIQELFPLQEVYFQHVSEFTFPDTNAPVTFDSYIPSLKLAFEYQGSYHFKDIMKFNGNNSNSVKVRDDYKRRLCETKGIDLISIPYWWDNSKQSLGATIHKIRPELLLDYKFESEIPSHRNKARFDAPVPDEEVVEEIQGVKYFLGYGRAESVSICRGCSKKFSKDEARIKVVSIVNKLQEGSLPTKMFIHFCVNPNCIERAKEVDQIRVQQKSFLLIQYPDYDGNVFVPSTVYRNMISIPGVKGIHWIKEPT